MPYQSTHATLEEVETLVRRKGQAWVERQYESGLLSAVIEPAFEQWKLQSARRQAGVGTPMAFATVMLLVACFAVMWSV